MTGLGYPVAYISLKRKIQCRSFEEKLFQTRSAEFKESTAYSDENVQEIAGNMGLKLEIWV